MTSITKTLCVSKREEKNERDKLKVLTNIHKRKREQNKRNVYKKFTHESKSLDQYSSLNSKESLKNSFTKSTWITDELGNELSQVLLQKILIKINFYYFLITVLFTRHAWLCWLC